MPIKLRAAREQAIFLASFYNGEGTAYAVSAYPGHSRQIQVCIQQSAERWEDGAPEVLRLIKKYVKIGKIAQRNTSTKYKPQWTWSVWTLEECKHVLRLMWPFLTRAKREQARAALAKYRASIPRKITHCKKDHPLYGPNLVLLKINGKVRQRACRKCRRAASERYELRKKAA